MGPPIPKTIDEASESSFAIYRYQVIMTEQTFRYDLLTIVVLFLILSTVFIVYFPLAAAIILGLTLSIVLQPLNQKLCERLSPAKSAAVTTVLVAVVIGFGLVLTLNLLISGGGMILSMIQDINTWLASLGGSNLISGKQIATTLDSITAIIQSKMNLILLSIPG